MPAAPFPRLLNPFARWTLAGAVMIAFIAATVAPLAADQSAKDRPGFVARRPQPPQPPQPPQGPKVETVEFKTVKQTHDAGFEKAQQVVISDVEAWKTFWTEFTKHGPFTADGKAEPAPKLIDFTKEQVVAVLAGQKPTGGWAARIVVVVKKGEDYEVRYKITGPEAGSITASVITYPGHVVVLPKCAGKITFAPVDKE